MRAQVYLFVVLQWMGCRYTLASSDFGVFDFTQNLAVVGNDNLNFKTIIFVDNVALDHRAVRKLCYLQVNTKTIDLSLISYYL